MWDLGFAGRAGVFRGGLVASWLGWRGEDGLVVVVVVGQSFGRRVETRWMDT